MKAENINASDYVDVFYKETVRAGKQVVLPFARSTPIFYYNKDAWAKAGLPDRGPNTWDEFNTDFAPKLKPLAPSVHALRRRGELLGVGLPGRRLGVRRLVLRPGLHDAHSGAELGQSRRVVALDGCLGRRPRRPRIQRPTSTPAPCCPIWTRRLAWQATSPRRQVQGRHGVSARGSGRLRLLHGRLGHGDYGRQPQGEAAGGDEVPGLRHGHGYRLVVAEHRLHARAQRGARRAPR